MSFGVEAPAFTAGVRDLPFSFCALALVVVGQNFAALGGRKSVIVRVRRQAGANGIIKNVVAVLFVIRLIADEMIAPLGLPDYAQPRVRAAVA